MQAAWQRPFRPISTTLPIFRQDDDAISLFYAPTYLVTVARAHADAFAQAVSGRANNAWSGTAEAQTLMARAADCQREQTASRPPFVPVGLTIYLHNACNLHCTYCYAEALPTRRERLAVETIRAAARLVAANCAKRDLPLAVVFHGGGEPTLDEALLMESLAAVEECAASQQVDVFRYIATNGVMPAARARRIAKHFDLVGLSCDGMPEIQAKQRPLYGGGSSMPSVERTARLLDEAGTPYNVRVTVTAESAPRLEEIAQYLCEHLHPQEIHVEPVYHAGRAALMPDDEIDTYTFIEAFLAGRTVAEGYGVKWMNSGSRLWERHGPYCNVFRDVVQITPEGTAVHCFKVAETTGANDTRVIGQPNGTHFEIDQQRIEALRHQLSQTPSACKTCFNRFHCTRGCPEQCPLEGASDSLPMRCNLLKGLATAAIQRTAADMPAQLQGDTYAIGREIARP